MDLFRNGSLEQILSALSGNQQFGSLVSSGSPTRKHFMVTPAVQFSSVRTAAAVAQPSRSGQASALAQVSRKNQKFSAVPLSEMKISKTVESYIYSLQISCSMGVVSPRVLPLCESVSADMTLPIGPSRGICKKPPEHHTFFGVSLYGVLTNGAQ